jgi:hypothetical protein
MRALSATRQREAGMGDDWARPVVSWEIEVVDAEAQRGLLCLSVQLGDW